MLAKTKPADLPLVDLLYALKDFLTPDRWTRGAFAKTKDGITCQCNDSNAKFFCIQGAVIHLLDDSCRNDIFKALDESARDLHGFAWESITVNDRLAYADVIKLIDHAIRREQSC